MSDGSDFSVSFFVCLFSLVQGVLHGPMHQIGVLGLAAMTASEASGGAVPLNAVTALLGAPVVLSVLVDGARRG